MSDAFRSPRQPPRSTVAVRDAAHSCGIDSPLVAQGFLILQALKIWRALRRHHIHLAWLKRPAHGRPVPRPTHGHSCKPLAPAPPSHAAIGRAGPAAAAAVGAHARSRWAAAPRRSAPSVPRSGRRAAAAQSSAPGPDDVGELSPEAAGVGEAGEEMAAHLRRHCDLPPRSCARCWCGSWRLACSVMHRPCEV